MRQRTKNRYNVAGTAVYKVNGRVEVDVSTIHGTSTMTAQQVAQLLAEIACEDHDAAVSALLIALRNERRGTERAVASLWVAMMSACDNWGRERLTRTTTPAASNQQVLGGRQRFAVDREE